MKSYSPAEILTLAWNLKVPVDLELIAGRMGIQVCLAALGESSSEIIIKDLYKEILLNTRESFVAQRYALAHAMGAIFSGLLPDGGLRQSFGATSYRHPATSRLDAEANRFALALLMPKDAIDLCIENGSRSVAEIAQIFLTSEAAVKVRLQSIGVLPASRPKI